MQLLDNVIHHEARINHIHESFAALLRIRLGGLLDFTLLLLVVWTLNFLNRLNLFLTVSHDVLNRCTLLRVHHKHLVYDIKQFRRVPGARQRRIICRNDLLEQIVQRHLLVFNFERALESAQLIYDATKRPHIALEVVAATLKHFR